MSELKVVCPHCNTPNMLPRERLADGPRCGRCKEAVFGGQPVEMDAAAFNRHVESNDIPLLIDFWAPWCGPCLSMAPAYAEAAGKLEPRVRLGKVNTEDEQMLGARFGIRSIPTMVLFLGGREVARRSGAMMAGDIVRWVQSQLPG
jgi:thioredoxin 2